MSTCPNFHQVPKNMPEEDNSVRFFISIDLIPCGYSDKAPLPTLSQVFDRPFILFNCKDRELD